MKPGHRYLVHDKESHGFIVGDPDIMEVKCIEASPNGRVKLEYISGASDWLWPKQFAIVEELP